MGRAEACLCCQEIERVKNKLIEAVTSGECEEQPKCITQHPGFHPVCINYTGLSLRFQVAGDMKLVAGGTKWQARGGGGG